MKNLRNIKDLIKTAKAGQRIIVRADFNLPMSATGEIIDQTRLIAIYPTIDYLLARGLKILLISHTASILGLRPIWQFMQQNYEIEFLESLKEINSSSANLILLENLRLDPREEANSLSLAQEIATYGDFYINDAFSVSHRRHSSIVNLPTLLPTAIGFSFEEELNKLSRILQPQHPFLLILGGAKIETKLNLIKKQLTKVDQIYLAGVGANSVYKKLGWSIGRSLAPDIGQGFMELLKSPKLILPSDFWVINSLGEAEIKKSEKVLNGDLIVDIGPESVAQLLTMVNQAQTIFWNGPLGFWEKGFNFSNLTLAENLSLITDDNYVLLGGGDTLASVQNSKHLISETKDNLKMVLSGGAALSFLTEGTVIGLEAIIDSTKSS